MLPPNTFIKLGGCIWKVTIVMRSVSALKCYENNPRHNENAVEKVAESIKEFGF